MEWEALIVAWEPFAEDDFWFGQGVPTYTIEEYLLSTVFPDPVGIYSDKTGEKVTYFNLNMLLASIEAYKKMGNTMKAYKFVKSIQMIPRVVRATPAFLVSAAAVRGTTDVAESLYMSAAYTGGADVPVASTKPAWIPLPLWVLFHGG